MKNKRKPEQHNRLLLKTPIAYSMEYLFILNWLLYLKSIANFPEHIKLVDNFIKELNSK